MAKAIKTPLYDRHVSLGGKMVEFAGFIMPVQYSGIIDEHVTVRENAGIFDLSHMGEFYVSGKGAPAALNKLVSNNVEKLKIGKALYTPVCTPRGGIVDDILVYRDADETFMLVVNASNIEKDYDWVVGHLPKGLTVEDKSLQTALVAVQGPQSETVLTEALADDLSELRYYEFIFSVMDDVPVRVSRTGYTGEDGFEVYVDAARAGEVWDVLFELTSGIGGVPVGLGARDTLRLEMKYCLYGNDIDEGTTPLEAGIGWTVKFDKGDFIGKETLVAQKNDGVKRRLAGFVMVDPGIPRRDYGIINIEEKSIGRVTSGSYSPSLRENIGLGYLELPYDDVGTEILVDIRKKPRLARVVETPFLKLIGGN
ncbi:MAG TPA: glycine cleavage system aminomethyltransferase GcvT [bacterium]|nr:glycine cleavage system aminomethyltransferase GcvT [bacterium]